MKTYLSCIPCFFKQILQAGEMGGLNPAQIKEMMDHVGGELEHFCLTDSPPRMGKSIQRLLTGYTGDTDPYAMVKNASNQKALAVYPELKRMVAQSDTPLRTAVELACAGNIIDYGIFTQELDVTAEIDRILRQQKLVLDRMDSQLFAFDSFSHSLRKCRNLWYVGDNAGEIVFDRVLIETIKDLFPQVEISFITRGKAVLNDCLVQDALQCGLDQVARIISSGLDSPGLLLDDVDISFKALFDQADLIISKGQGNYEALSSSPAPIYFLLVAKCAVIAQDLGCRQMDLILKKHGSAF
ncbi:MAG: DUF89 domain-containing protein [Sphaerochaetaceae bacterium]